MDTTTISINKDDHSRLIKHILTHQAKTGKRISTAEFFNIVLDKYEK